MAAGVLALANRGPVALFTLTSVAWAESMTASTLDQSCIATLLWAADSLLVAVQHGVAFFVVHPLVLSLCFGLGLKACPGP